MRFADVERRLKRLEHHTEVCEATYAIQMTDVDLVVVTGTHERLSLELFRERYPDGVIVQQLEEAMWDAL